MLNLTKFVVALGSFFSLCLCVSSEAGQVEGLTEPFQKIELAAGEPGILYELDIREGDHVRRDQVVARLDTNVLGAALRIARTRSEAKGALQAAVAEQTLKVKHLEQFRSLREKGHATQRELERAQTDFQIAQSRVLMAQEELTLQRLECERIEAQIERRRIRSPVDGVVSEVFKDVGESFLASDPKVMTIVQLDQLRVRFPATMQEAASFAPGDSVKLIFPRSKRTADGVVELISPVIDADSGTIDVLVLINNRDGRLRSGERCVLSVLTAGSQRTRHTSKSSK